MNNENKENQYLALKDRITPMDFTAEEEDFILTDWEENLTWLLSATRKEIQAWLDANL
jgi:hypothetical protein